MQGGFLDIILLAMIVAVIAFRLYSVLGRRTGHERSPEEQVHVPDARAKQGSSDNVVKLPERSTSTASANDPILRARMDIKLADRHFDEAQFMEGARAAYEMIVVAFAEGDREALRPLLNEEVYSAFDRAISERERRNQSMEFNFLGLEAAEITGAELKDRMAEITVAFKSEVIEALRDKNGDLVEGESIAATHVNDVWTFARDIKSRDPNWLLVATSSA